MSQVFRVERTRNFTVMANYHLKDKRLSLKAKGLLSGHAESSGRLELQHERSCQTQ